MAVYDVEELLDKVAIAKVETAVYKGDLQILYKKVPTGGSLGTVFSWITRNGQTWLMSQLNGEMVFFLPSGVEVIGAKDVKEKEKERVENESKNVFTEWLRSILPIEVQNVLPYFGWGLLTLCGLWLLSSVFGVFSTLSKGYKGIRQSTKGWSKMF